MCAMARCLSVLQYIADTPLLYRNGWTSARNQHRMAVRDSALLVPNKEPREIKNDEILVDCLVASAKCTQAILLARRDFCVPCMRLNYI